MKRTDEHAPSRINPNSYEFVAALVRDFSSFGNCEALLAEQRILDAHMDRTGGTWSRHEHGGNCMICGAYMIHEAVFYHEKTNSYIRTGFDCADKLDMGDQNRFKRIKTAREAARQAKAGILKAQGLLEERGLWTFASALFPDGLNGDIEFPRGYEDTPIFMKNDCNTFADIVRKLVRYGSLSDKQWNFLGVLRDRIENYDEIQKKREEARAHIPDAPKGRVAVKGTVLSVKQKWYGDDCVWKWTVKTEEGFKVWSTLPSVLIKNDSHHNNCPVIEKGDKVAFRITLEPSDNDSKFAFGSRPTNAELLQKAA